MIDFSNCYSVLGVTPHTDWDGVRARYKRLIGQWHPDRFSAGAADILIAEEHSKQITLAYQALEKYRRDHGVLPPMAPPVSIERAQEPKRDSGQASERAHSENRAETRRPDRDLVKRNPNRQRFVVITLSILIGALYFVLRSHVSSHDDRPAYATPPTAATRAPPRENSDRESRTISVDSTLGEVYAIQGVPTRTMGDTWYYGESQILFSSQGKVISWIEEPGYPLQIPHYQAPRSYGEHFDVGSTKAQVRAIQGAPVTETDAVWEYPPSRVYFDQGRVVRWDESPMQPLRIPR
jgi:hypothetical protein